MSMSKSRTLFGNTGKQVWFFRDEKLDELYETLKKERKMKKDIPTLFTEPKATKYLQEMKVLIAFQIKCIKKRELALMNEQMSMWE